MADATENKRNGKGVVDKVAAILMAFSFDDPELDLREISRRVELNKSTTCRILRKLMQYRFIEQDPATGLYRLGIRLFELGNLVADNLKLGEVARPYLEALTERVGETSHFAILSGDRIVHLVRIESQQAIRVVPSRLGERYPFHCLSVGKAIVAFLSEEEREALLARAEFEKFTDRTITSRAAFEEELEEIRRCGYALDNEEFIEGIRCIGAPVRGYKGRVIGGISVAGPAMRLTSERIAELIPFVVETAAEISRCFAKDQAEVPTGKIKEAVKAKR